jgi:RimJ/RimL family protein N-acetyltransferase
MSVLVAENFLKDFGALEAFQGNFSEVENLDGAVYPAVCDDLPREVKSDLYRAIMEQVGFTIAPNKTLLRRFEEGNVEPYQAHTDMNMGAYTCIVYKQGKGGTSFVRHIETGMTANDPQFAAEWDKDKNNYEAWEIYHFEGLRPNKAVVYDATLMHRGEPITGHGKGEDARELLICFFDPSLLQRSTDAESIMYVLKHPAIWENIGGTGDSFELPIDDDHHYLINQGAVIILHPEGDDWVIHVNIVPEFRHIAYELAMEALGYAFDILGANRVIASIPKEHENVYRFSLKCGMGEEALVEGEHRMVMGYEQWVS